MPGRTIERNVTGTTTGACGHSILLAAEYVWDEETEAAYCSSACAEHARSRSLAEQQETAVRFLLDGLQVADLAELRELVERGRVHERLTTPIRCAVVPASGNGRGDNDDRGGRA